MRNAVVIARIPASHVVRLRLIGDGLVWEWSAADDGRTEEGDRWIEAALAAFADGGTFEFRNELNLWERERWVIVRIGTAPMGPTSMGTGERELRFVVLALDDRDPDDPIRRAIEGLMTWRPAKGKPWWRPIVGPMPEGFSPSPLYREDTSPPGTMPGMGIGPPRPNDSFRIGPTFEGAEVANWFLRREGGTRGGLTLAELHGLTYLAYGWQWHTYGLRLLREGFRADAGERPVSVGIERAFAGRGTERFSEPANETMSVGTLGAGDFAFVVKRLVANRRVEEILEFVWSTWDGSLVSGPSDEAGISAEFARRAGEPGAFTTFRYYPPEDPFG